MAGGNVQTSPHHPFVRDADACWRWSYILVFFLVGPTQHYALFYDAGWERLLNIALCTKSTHFGWGGWGITC
jgi:hypothetical protein